MEIKNYILQMKLKQPKVYMSLRVILQFFVFI